MQMLTQQRGIIGLLFKSRHLSDITQSRGQASDNNSFHYDIHNDSNQQKTLGCGPFEALIFSEDMMILFIRC